MKLVHAFHSNTLDLSRMNLAFICLIQKKSDANIITQYRPINLINYSMKIITKLLIEKLSPLMHSLIAPTQTTYIKGRYIMDNIVCTH
jgi:Reverse transcriptase (RNA-dependent DNA polymerase)